MSKRINWLDSSKFLGILFIYLFHIGEHAGYMRTYSIQFCVHIFFILAGFTERLHPSKSLKDCLIKNTKKILIPFYLLATISLLFGCVVENSYKFIIRNALFVIKGVPRGWFPAVALWFLTCLFIIRVSFYIIRRLLKKDIYIFTATLLFFMIGSSLITQKARPLEFFNTDNALYFLVFYFLGFHFFDMVRSLMELDTIFKKTIFAIAGIVSFAYSLLVFFGKYPLDILSAWGGPFALLVELVHPLVLCVFILVAAKLIEDVPFFRVVGQNSLYLCGSEFMIDTSLVTTLLYFGVIPNYSNSLATLLYAMFMLTVGHYLFVPVEKAILKKLGC